MSAADPARDAQWRDAIHDAYMKGRLAGPPDPDRPAAPDDMEELRRRRDGLADGQAAP